MTDVKLTRRPMLSVSINERSVTSQVSVLGIGPLDVRSASVICDVADGQTFVRLDIPLHLVAVAITNVAAP